MAGTNWTEVDNFDDMLASANSGVPFWSLMLMMIWIVLSITFMPFGTTVALLAGSFVAGLMGIFLVYMGLVAWKWVLMLFAIVIGIVIWETIFAPKD